ncbi:hypothetical protein EV651_12248 [Kribbella sp. VKM Ac-2571]|uniref:hypothetical protein n=1 Tax=Kribbella sp. VKM Ac-2571 TaxID=2512222 RepID=UPI00105CD622|nr:hypothetical protein [Kribbella sp. VKM Ac-2571]TDO48924.1 hypothetical protein EV651_12248 [Kribbella sp. VKM Ac-2571]
MKAMAIATGLLMLLAGCSTSSPAAQPTALPDSSPAATTPGPTQAPSSTPTGGSAPVVLPGDRYVALATALHHKGVAIWWETDLVKRWLDGQAAFDGAIARLGQLASVPGTAGFKISDEIGYGDGLTSPAQAADFLRQARSGLAKVAPGKQILVDAVVPELGCLPWRGGNQEGCAQRVRLKYPAASAAAVEGYLRTDLIDRLDLSTGLLSPNTYQTWGLDQHTAQTEIWSRVRAQGWESLTILQSRKALAAADGYQGNAAQAATDTATYIAAPVSAGAQAVDIWTWRQRYQGKVFSLLAPDLGSNALWTSLLQERRLGVRLITHMTPSTMPTDSAAFDHECDLAAHAFTAVFVAAGTG